MHSLIDESTTVKALDHHVHLSAKARADGTHFCSHGIESHSSHPQSHHTKYGQMDQVLEGVGRPGMPRPSGHLLGSRHPLPQKSSSLLY